MLKRLWPTHKVLGMNSSIFTACCSCTHSKVPVPLRVLNASTTYVPQRVSLLSDNQLYSEKSTFGSCSIQYPFRVGIILSFIKTGQCFCAIWVKSQVLWRTKVPLMGTCIRSLGKNSACPGIYKWLWLVKCYYLAHRKLSGVWETTWKMRCSCALFFLTFCKFANSVFYTIHLCSSCRIVYDIWCRALYWNLLDLFRVLLTNCLQKWTT